jgi:hypothetical protein
MELVIVLQHRFAERRGRGRTQFRRFSPRNAWAQLGHTLQRNAAVWFFNKLIYSLVRGVAQW